LNQLGGEEFSKFKEEVEEVKEYLTDYIEGSNNPLIVIPQVVLSKVMNPSLAQAISKT
jgi:hypothetical protein